LELSIKKVARESGISGKLAHSKRCVSGRGDIILYKDEMPHSIIEVKNGVDRIDNIIQDIERISYIISKEKTKTSWKFGVIAFLIDIDLIDRENQNIVDKLENKIKNIFAEAQKISELVREYHYDIRSESYELNGKKRNWGWSPVCITFS